ncbi:hypothetical protein AB0K08_13610 [Citricoccus sp. NPDC055426]|uniref:hypothetical protein n=1 Tax=Citricoccus sp. NPDC055426 TaxID=3155536 RepID=UPI003449F7B8
MEVTCAECDEPFEAKRRTARFCSDKCRVRHHRKKGPKLPAAVKKAAAAATARAALADDVPDFMPENIPDEENEEPVEETVEATVRAELVKAGKHRTVMGQAALVLARRLDLPTMDTGSAVAALVKQLEATLETALAGAEEEEDELEKMRRRREEKLAANQ